MKGIAKVAILLYQDRKAARKRRYEAEAYEQVCNMPSTRRNSRTR